MKSLMLFTDGSVNNKTKVGVGAYLLLSEQDQSRDLLAECVKTHIFYETSSTRLELQVLLMALDDIGAESRLTVYTDSQNIVNLSARRERLEKSGFLSTKGRRLNNADLYCEFFKKIDIMHLTFEKVAGHRVSSDKTQIDHLFSLVDKASRRALRDIS